MTTRLLGFLTIGFLLVPLAGALPNTPAKDSVVAAGTATVERYGAPTQPFCTDAVAVSVFIDPDVGGTVEVVGTCSQGVSSFSHCDEDVSGAVVCDNPGEVTLKLGAKGQLSVQYYKDGAVVATVRGTLTRVAPGI